jgi:hypothetical protein
MKRITGTFVDSDGKPFAYDNLTLELQSDNDDAGDDPCERYKPIEATEEQAKDFTGYYSFQLNGEGKPPSDTKIFANDELTGGGGYYKVAVTLGRGTSHKLCFKERLRIAGPEPIDLTTLIPFDYVVPEPQPAPALPPRPRVAPPRKSPTTNYVGFFAGPVHFPVPNAAPVTVGRSRGSHGFTLPFSALVSCASVYVVSPVPGGTLLLELWDTKVKKCSAPIAVGKDGVASVFFEPVPLSPGDYELRWSGERLGAQVQLLGVNYQQQQIELINAGGGAQPATANMPLVYFKA